jgi:hypothetical protein
MRIVFNIMHLSYSPICRKWFTKLCFVATAVLGEEEA